METDPVNCVIKANLVPGKAIVTDCNYKEITMGGAYNNYEVSEMTKNFADNAYDFDKINQLWDGFFGVIKTKEVTWPGR